MLHLSTSLLTRSSWPQLNLSVASPSREVLCRDTITMPSAPPPPYGRPLTDLATAEHSRSEVAPVVSSHRTRVE